MRNNDYGYFGKGTTGYVHYMQAFNRSFGNGGGSNGGGSGNGCGCLIAAVIIAVFLIFISAIAT